MNYRSKIIIAAVLTAIIVGGGVYAWQHARVRSLSAEIGTLSYDLSELRGELGTSNMAHAEKAVPMEQRVRELENEVRTLREYPEGGQIPLDLLTVYTSTDEAPDNPIPDYYIAVRENLAVIEKLKILASRLSKQRFSGLPINIVGIKSVKGKRIATIDLQEISHDIRQTMWRTSYFQGSIGGGLTQTTLVYTFLQRKYRGDWVDGVRFLYEGKPVGEWDHINFAEVLYR